MKELVKKIRENLGINQEQLSGIVGVSPVTISRWETGKAFPSLMAQKQLYEICKDNKIELADYIVNRECRENAVLLYHASRNGIEGNIRPISRSRCDFGKGFYMGTDPLQPLTLICGEENPVFYTVSFDMAGLKVLNIEVGMEWAMLIAFYRGYMDEFQDSYVYRKYSHLADGCDVICGYIADDRMYQVLTDFFDGRITDTALIASLSALKLGKQYVAVSQKACDKIKIIRERKLSRLELMLLQDKSEVRRREGKELADRMVMLHRRDGQFFDEILKGTENNG